MESDRRLTTHPVLRPLLQLQHLVCPRNTKTNLGEWMLMVSDTRLVIGQQILVQVCSVVTQTGEDRYVRFQLSHQFLS